MLCSAKKTKNKNKKKTEKGRCYGAQCIMGRTIKIAVVFTQHGVGLVRSASGGLTKCGLRAVSYYAGKADISKAFWILKGKLG